MAPWLPIRKIVLASYREDLQTFVKNSLYTKYIGFIGGGGGGHSECTCIASHWPP